MSEMSDAHIRHIAKEIKKQNLVAPLLARLEQGCKMKGFSDPAMERLKGELRSLIKRRTNTKAQRSARRKNRK